MSKEQKEYFAPPKPDKKFQGYEGEISQDKMDLLNQMNELL